MKHILVLGIALATSMSAHAVNSSKVKLGSDSKTITNKARSIEAEYARDMRNSADEHRGALTIEEGFTPSSTETAPMETSSAISRDADEISQIPGANNSYYSSSPQVNSFFYPSTLKMREDRRAGVGLAVGGATGLFGAVAELNIEDADGVIAGFGTGPGYNSVQIGWKHAFEGQFLAPYTTVSYSRWYNSRGRTTDYGDSNILDRVLTDNEKREGKFGTDFVNASAGLQFNQLSGDLAGVSVFGELTGMYEVKRAMLLPSGSIGALYYF